MLPQSHAGELLLVQKNNHARGIILHSQGLYTHQFPPFSLYEFYLPFTDSAGDRWTQLSMRSL